LLNDRVLPAFAEQGMAIPADAHRPGYGVLRARRASRHEHYLAINDIEHTKTKARTRRTNGHLRALPQAVLQEFYQFASAASSTPRSQNYRSTWMLDPSLQHRAHAPGQDVVAENADGYYACGKGNLRPEDHGFELI